MQAALRRPPEPGKWISAVFSVLMHAVLVFVLFYGVQWQRRAPEAVSVELVRGLPSTPMAQPEVAPPPQPRPEPKPEPKVVPKQEVKPEPPKPVVKPDIALKEPKTKKEPPKPEPPKKVVEPEPKKPEPPKKVVEKPEPKKVEKPVDTTNDRLNDLLNSETKRTASVSNQAKLDAAAKDASARRAAAETSAAAVRASAEWGDRIRNKVRSNIVRTRDYPGNPTLEFEIDLLPDRSIVGEPRLLKSSGHAELDEAVKRAIVASSPLPAPPTADAFQRRLKLVFHPMQD